MAEIQTVTAGNQKAGVRRAKRLSTRVDLTLMVDLGFLLITFFVFTTSISKPQGLNIIIPAEEKKEPPTVTAESKTLNLLLAADNKIHYWVGNEVGNQICTNFSPDGIRSVIRMMQKKVQKQFGNKDETVILIRPTNDASYQNLVDIIDEIAITGIKKYALMDAAEKQLLQVSNVKKPC